MINLFRSNLSRLFHSNVFKAGEIFSVGYAIFALVGSYISNRNVYGDEFQEQLKSGHLLDNLPLALALAFPIILAVVTGFFIGTEYSDGTIRNKLIAGHSRISIYFANMLTTYIASILLFLTSVIVIYAGGIPLYGSTSLPFQEYLKAICVILVAGFAFCSLNTLLCMAIQNKALSSVAVIILTVVMFMAMMTINSRLAEPEYYDNYSYTNGKSPVIQVDKEKNPHYLTGKKREIYEKISNFLPYTHMHFLVQNVTLPDKPYEFPLNSGIMILITTAAGTIIFKKRDLK